MVECKKCKSKLVSTEHMCEIEPAVNVLLIWNGREKDEALVSIRSRHMEINDQKPLCETCEEFYDRLFRSSGAWIYPQLHGVVDGSDRYRSNWYGVDESLIKSDEGKLAYDLILDFCEQFLPHLSQVEQMLGEEFLSVFRQKGPSPLTFGLLIHTIETGDPFENVYAARLARDHSLPPDADDEVIMSRLRGIISALDK